MSKNMEQQYDKCYIGITADQLDPKSIMDRVRSPKAGAIVLFAGTTRDNFDGKTVKELEYQSYAPKAIKTMLEICTAIVKKWSLTSIAMIHRTGVVPIGEESILIAVSSPHRKEAFEAAEEALEECKLKVEIWKKELFEEGNSVWKANDQNVTDGSAREPSVLIQDLMLGRTNGQTTAPSVDGSEGSTLVSPAS